MFSSRLKCAIVGAAGICLAFICTFDAANGANIVINGGFEVDTPLIANPPNPNVTASQQPTGWLLTSQDANAPHAFVLGGVGVGGSQGIDFNGYDVVPNAILSQALVTSPLVTSPGTLYDFSFSFGTIGGNSISQSLRVEAIGTGPDLLNQVVSRTNVQALSQEAFQFTANSALTTIRFSDISTATASLDGVIDNVSVSATASSTMFRSPPWAFLSLPACCCLAWDSLAWHWSRGAD
jgi:hypothetical protein